MAHDFELRRLTDKLKKLTEEQTRVNQQILKSRRDEQYELDYIRRRFNSQIQALENKQQKITKDMTTYERQLDNLEKTMQEEKEEEKQQRQDKQQTYEPSHRRYR
jgi:chromosome segregation ATPase